MICTIPKNCTLSTTREGFTVRKKLAIARSHECDRRNPSDRIEGRVKRPSSVLLHCSNEVLFVCAFHRVLKSLVLNAPGRHLARRPFLRFNSVNLISRLHIGKAVDPVGRIKFRFIRRIAKSETTFPFNVHGAA